MHPQRVVAHGLHSALKHIAYAWFLVEAGSRQLQGSAVLLHVCEGAGLRSILSAIDQSRQ